MSYLTQKTIKNNISFSGIGLHSGLVVNVCIKPASPNYGIVFKRVDLNNNNIVYPNFMNVTNTSLNTTIENEFGVKVSTIEHLMCALFGIDPSLSSLLSSRMLLFFLERYSVFGVNDSKGREASCATELVSRNWRLV